jgi:hypothetical protein
LELEGGIVLEEDGKDDEQEDGRGRDRLIEERGEG